MGDIMRPVPMEELLTRIFKEYRNHYSIFGIDGGDFYKDEGKHRIKVFGQECTTPIGPAAGPHTQLAQNIITSYLTGGRFMELKTVQIMDTLEIAKPCIDARDEGFNTEWSTEYTLKKARYEYYKAWIILHFLDALMFEGKWKGPSFIFNMSVGYDLKGIKEQRMQEYINGMMDASEDEQYREYIEVLNEFISDKDFLSGTPWEGKEKKVKNLIESISPKICQSVTISTMHGCPPAEIEAICTYMLKEKGLNTFVKLNPTLLGYDKVREILDSTGFNYVTIKRESFEKDLQYSDAVEMLKRLISLGKEKDLGFGVKLTNTLGSVNNLGQLPGDEMYMSGRALMPISINVADKLSTEFDGKLPISYSGGANAFTISDIFDTGIRPVTLATDMLKPGGYARMKQMAEILETSETWNLHNVIPSKVNELAEKAVTLEYLQKAFHGNQKAKVNDELPMFDCYVSPCMEACPIHAQIPDYISLVGDERYREALEVIYDDNPLPGITCNICDHKCQDACVRNDYEGSVKIREMKKVAFDKGYEEYINDMILPGKPSNIKAAVVGAGPAGLAAAYFLRRSCFNVTVFEKEPNAGGVVRNVIPEFRIPVSAIEKDIAMIEKIGVEFKFSYNDVSIKSLQKQGYDYIFYCIGAPVENQLDLTGQGVDVKGALDFLTEFRKNPNSVTLGRNVVVCGGGNTAMDSARAALKVPGVDKVTVVYRRTDAEMPAAREEYEMALQEGIEFKFLTVPETMEDNVLILRKMKLGEPDESGRRRPEKTDETEMLETEVLICAIGEKIDGQLVNNLGLPINEYGKVEVDSDTLETSIDGVFVIGDAQTGPSTVVECIAGARKGVEQALSNELGDEQEEHDHCCDHDHHHDEEDEEISDSELEEMDEEEKSFFDSIRIKKSKIRPTLDENDKDFAVNEAARCLDCTYLCNKCIEVCPNRANVAIDMRFSQETNDPFQIVHLDAFCNECGNCAAFCSHEGKPYKDKFTIFSRIDDYENSENSGFVVENDIVKVRIEGKETECKINRDGLLEGNIPEIARDLIEEIFFEYDYLLTAVEE